MNDIFSNTRDYRGILSAYVRAGDGGGHIGGQGRFAQPEQPQVPPGTVFMPQPPLSLNPSPPNLNSDSVPQACSPGGLVIGNPNDLISRLDCDCTRDNEPISSIYVTSPLAKGCDAVTLIDPDMREVGSRAQMISLIKSLALRGGIFAPTETNFVNALPLSVATFAATTIGIGLYLTMKSAPDTFFSYDVTISLTTPITLSALIVPRTLTIKVLQPDVSIYLPWAFNSGSLGLTAPQATVASIVAGHTCNLSGINTTSFAASCSPMTHCSLRLAEFAEVAGLTKRY